MPADKLWRANLHVQLDESKPGQFGTMTVGEYESIMRASAEATKASDRSIHTVIGITITLVEADDAGN